MTTIKHILVTLLILFVILCIAFWALVLAGRVDVGADGNHWPVTDQLLTTVRENSVSRRARGIEAKLPEFTEEVALFEAVIGFEDMCAKCHTPPGGSPTALARGLNPQATDLTWAGANRSPAELFWVTRNGIRMTGMPAWGPTHSDDELWALVALMTRFPDFSDDDYGNMLVAAREAGVEHTHDHDHNDNDRHDHEHDDSHHSHHRHDHDDDVDQTNNGDDHEH